MRAIMVSFMAMGLLASPVWSGDESEEVTAIASPGRSADGAVAGRAGRAAYYLLFGEDGRLLEAASNPARDTGHGAGSSAAAFLAGKGVTLVVAGTFGPKMLRALEGRQIGHVEFSGLVTDALEKLGVGPGPK